MDPTSNLQPFLDALLKAFTSHNWALLVALGLVGLMALLRKVGATKIPFLGTKLGGWISLFGMSFAGAVAAALGTGAALNGPLFASAAGVALAAAGGYEALKDFLPASMQFLLTAVERGGSEQALTAAKAAGDKAAQAVVDAAPKPKTVADIVNDAKAKQ